MSLKIKDLQQEDKPRERLKSYGADRLTNRELLAIIINSGSKQFSSIDCANQVLKLVNQLRDLRHLTLPELLSVNGIGEKKALTILAVIELAKRMHSNTVLDKIEINEPQDVADYLMEKLRYLKQEHFVALLLNTKNQIIHEQSIFIGSLNMSIVHPRDLLREAVKHSAASIVIAHNHPSGDPTPSLEDIKTTKRLLYCCDLMGIDLLDHIIIGDGEFISLFEDDYITKELKGLKGKERVKQIAINNTVNRVHQAMEAFIHNMNTIHSRGGNQVVFSSINYGTDTTPEGRCIIREILQSTYEGVGNGETAIFPIQIWKKKRGVNYLPEDRNYDLYQFSCKVAAKRFFPNYINLDATFNQNEKWKAGIPVYHKA